MDIVWNNKKITFHHGTTVLVYIVFEKKLWLNDLDSKFTVLNSLFGAVKFTKNADPDKYSYSGYGILMYIEPFWCQIAVILVKM